MKAKTVLKPIENEAFWKRHYEQQKLSGMRRSDYCNQHNLNYDRFGYWICKWNRNQHTNDKLISVKLKSTTSEFSESALPLCILDLKNGNHLKIYDSKVLDIIFERYS